MKILLVHNYYKRPGGEDVVFEQERQLLANAGHQVLTYCRSNNDVDSYRGLGQIALAAHAVWARDSRSEILSLLRRERPDLVHVHNTLVMISPSIYSACREEHVPVVQTLHNYRLFCPAATFFRDGHICEECVSHSLWRGIWYGCYRDSCTATAAISLILAVHRRRRTWTDEVDRYITLTEFARSKLVGAGLQRDKVSVKPNFVHPDPGVGELGEYALFVGRLSPEKRVALVLQAWRRLRSRIPLFVIGGGPEKLHLQQEAERLGLSVRFTGQLPRAETLAAIRKARFVVFTSEWYETFGMTLIESFACGVPIICSRLGAIQEIVNDGRTGLHFEPGNVEELAEKVEWAWSHLSEMRAMGKEARREYESKYTAEKNYPLLMGIYQRAISESGLARMPHEAQHRVW